MASNYENKLYKDYEKLVRDYEKLQLENKHLYLRATIAEDEQIRLEKIVEKKEKEVEEKNAIIEEQNQEILKLVNKLEISEYVKQQYLSKLNIDGTNSGIPTSKTPINKKKVIPNSREKSGASKGGQFGHKKHKLEKFNDEEINEKVEHHAEECPYCQGRDLKDTGKNVSKDELDYLIKIIKRRNNFTIYECQDCHKEFHKDIPVHLKEENQYGSNVQALSLSLMNVGNVAINKVKRIISGISMEEIDLSEGYISKLQKRGANKLEEFIKDLKFYITHLKLVYWDDTGININKKLSCMRFYGNENVALYCAHEKKNKMGLDEDNILGMLSSTTVVEHDHNKVNYNPEYTFMNAECCVHLLRDLQKVTDNIPTREWSKELKDHFQKYDHKRKELIEAKKDSFEFEDLNLFIAKIDELLLKGIEENEADSKVYYAKKEKTLLYRIMEYRDNYVYWILDFDIPFDNNLSERGLRYIKSKMKVSGQFQNIETARYYATINSYIETARRNGINEHDALVRLINGNPYSLDEMLQKNSD